LDANNLEVYPEAEAGAGTGEQTEIIFYTITKWM
jgi:hypothetical protein